MTVEEPRAESREASRAHPSSPLIHLACTQCHAEVWWPADLVGDLRCPQCGGGLQPPPATPSGQVDPMAHAVGLLRRLAEHHRRNADEQRRERADTVVAPPDDVLFEQARAAHRLELLAAALDRLTVEDVDALRYVVDAQPAPTAEAEALRARARQAVATLADLLIARDARG